MGSSELSKLKGPNQETGTKLAPKKYSSHMPQSSSPIIEELTGILVLFSIPLKTCGAGPRSLAAKEYNPRAQPIIRPFKVPRQEITTKTKRTVPPMLENRV